MRGSGRGKMKNYADRYSCSFYPDEKPLGVQADFYMPCAIQNDESINSTKKIAASGSKYHFEVANIPTTNGALSLFKEQNI